MSKQKKVIIITAVIVVSIIVVVISIFSNIKSNGTIKISGILEANKIEVPALVSGVVEKVNITDGATVNKGDTILKVDSAQLQIKKEQALSVVKQAEAQLELIKSGASPAEIRQFQAKVKQAQANLQNVSSGARPEEIAQAQTKVDSLKANLDQLSQDYESAQRLFEQDVISKSKLDETKTILDNTRSSLKAATESLKLLKKGATTGQINIARQQVAESKAALNMVLQGSKPAQIKAAQAQVDQTKSELKLIEQMISDSEIKSPTRGTISELTTNNGELITKGGVVASILDLEHLWVKLFVPESKIVFLKLNQPTTVIPEALSKVTFPGKITYIANQGAFIPPGTKESPDQQVFEVKVSLERSHTDSIQLRPGMTVIVKINKSNNFHK